MCGRLAEVVNLQGGAATHQKQHLHDQELDHYGPLTAAAAAAAEVACEKLKCVAKGRVTSGL